MASRLHDILAARRSKDGDKGFTLIELLVVVLIIGILAAIAIPVFLGQQDSAKDAAAKSDISNIKLAIVGFYAAGNTTADPTAAQLKTYGYAQSGTNAPTVKATDAQNFCVSEVSSSSSAPTFKSTAGAASITTGSPCATAAG